MKKINILLVLFSLFILFSCENPVNTPPLQTPSIPAGKGAFTLLISDINGRTILPTTKLSDFAEYTLEFFPEGGGTLDPVTRTNITLATDPIVLNIGKYDLRVTAYMGAGKVNPAAEGWLPGIEIEDGKYNTGSVSLTAIIEGTGTFRWNITLPADITVASMTITPLDTTNGPTEQTLYFIGGTPTILESDSLPLKSGYYNVLITLKKDNDTQPIKRYDILHIYQNLESFFEFTSTGFYTKNYLVTFVYHNGLADGLQTCEIDKTTNKPNDPDKSGYVFGGWYTVDPPQGGTWDLADKWDFDVNTVTDNITLYANWQTAGTFTFKFEISDTKPVVDSGIFIFANQDSLTTAAELTVTNAGTFDEIKWYYNNTSQGTGANVSLSPSIFDNVSGPKFITVQAEKGGKLYSTLVIIWVRVPAARIGTDLYATLYDAIEAATTDGTETTITLLSDVTTPETKIPYVPNPPETGLTPSGYTINNGQNITLNVENDCNLSINASTGSFALFTVYSGGTLTLDGSNGALTLSGGYLAVRDGRRGISIDDNGTVAIKDNVTIAGFRNSAGYSGGGVSVNSGASFTMSGGTIYGNGSDVPEKLRNEAATGTAAIYVGTSGTAKYGGRYGTDNISSTSYTLPLLGTPTINPAGTVNTYTKLYAVYNGSQTVSYQWLSSSTSSGSSTTIDGATSPTYTPVSAGYYSVTVSAPGYTSKTSDKRQVSLSTLAGKININPPGLVTSGTTLTAGYTGTEPVTNNVTLNYQWRKETSDISDATTSIFTPTDPGIYNLTLSGTGYTSKTSSASNGDIVAFITTPTVIDLIEDKWSDGTLTETNPQDWYSFDVVSGTTYYVWVNNGTYNYGDGTKTINTYLSIIYDDGKLVYLNRSYTSSWSGTSFTPASGFSGKVYIQVKPYSSSSLGTYGIVYSTGTERPINNTLDLSGITPTLSQDVWKLDKLSADNPRYWYSFNVTSGTTYYLWWNEKSNSFFGAIDGITPADVDVTVWYSNNKEAMPNTDTAWSAPKSFTADMTGTVTILVRPKSASSSNYGAFEIAYSAGSSTRPSGDHGSTPPNATALTPGTWENGELTSASPNKWYSFPVVSGTTYRVWWNDHDSDSSKMDVRVSAYYDDGTQIFYREDFGSSAHSFTPTSDVTVYLLVEPYSNGGTGTFGVVFSTSSTKP